MYKIEKVGFLLQSRQKICTNWCGCSKSLFSNTRKILQFNQKKKKNLTHNKPTLEILAHTITLRAFSSKFLKNLAFTISKSYFIYFNISLNNTPNVKSFIFFTTSLKYYFFIIF